MSCEIRETVVVSIITIIYRQRQRQYQTSMLPSLPECVSFFRSRLKIGLGTSPFQSIAAYIFSLNYVWALAGLCCPYHSVYAAVAPWAFIRMTIWRTFDFVRSLFLQVNISESISCVNTVLRQAPVRWIRSDIIRGYWAFSEILRFYENLSPSSPLGSWPVLLQS